MAQGRGVCPVVTVPTPATRRCQRPRGERHSATRMNGTPVTPLRVLYLNYGDPAFATIPDDALVEAFSGSPHELIFFDHQADLEPQFENIDVVIDLGGSIGTRRMLHAATSARLWQVLGYGLDHFELDYWASQDMVTAHCPGPASAVALAEFAMMQMLMLARRYPEARASAEAQRWYSPFGMELENRVLGLVGFGASARALATRALAFGMRLMAIEKQPVSSEDIESFRLEFVAGPERLDEMLPHLDFVSMHLPLNEETHHILSRRPTAVAPDLRIRDQRGARRAGGRSGDDGRLGERSPGGRRSRRDQRRAPALDLAALRFEERDPHSARLRWHRRYLPSAGGVGRRELRPDKPRPGAAVPGRLTHCVTPLGPRGSCPRCLAQASRDESCNQLTVFGSPYLP